MPWQRVGQDYATELTGSRKAELMIAILRAELRRANLSIAKIRSTKLMRAELY